MPTWTAEQVLALAPDSASTKAGRNLANAAKWRTLGHDEQALWGECQGSGADAYQTEIDLTEPAFKCTCPSRKFPCKHALGLFLLFANQPASVPAAQPPDWVVQWLERRAQTARRKQAPAATPDDPAQQAKKAKAKANRTAQREAKVSAGLIELERWLHDLMRQGLAHAQTQPARYWDTIAARMIDAQAPGIARWLRDMASLPAAGGDWAEQLLTRLGRLHLLIEGHKRLATLAKSTQADLRSAIGWTCKAEDLATEPGVRDHWLALGRHSYEEDNLRVQRTWLWGQQSRRTALLLDFTMSGQAPEVRFAPGTCLDAELVFYPSAYPLRASVRTWGEVAPITPPPAHHATITDLLAAHAAALACQPWLEYLPAAIQALVPYRHESGWRVRDADGCWLPLSSRFTQHWHLLAISGGEPVLLFGEWDGRCLLPLSAWIDERFIRF